MVEIAPYELLFIRLLHNRRILCDMGIISLKEKTGLQVRNASDCYGDILEKGTSDLAHRIIPLLSSFVQYLLFVHCGYYCSKILQLVGNFPWK